MVDELRTHVGTRRKVQLERSRPSTPRLGGYLLACSERWGLLHAFDDFEPDGYTVFAIADVVSVRSGPYEQIWDRMLEGERLLGGLDGCAAVDLTDVRTAIASIDLAYGRMIVECEDADEDLQDFYLGSVVRLGDRSVWFDHFDALGVWAAEPAEIELDDITLLQFETPYIERFWRYVGPRPHHA